MKTPFLLAAAAALLALPAAADNGQDMGILSCRLTGDQNLVIYSEQEFACVFEPKSGAGQNYTGRIRSLGVDLEFSKDVSLTWAVLTTRTDGSVADQLRGDYVGAGASVAVVGGVGLNALVGGNDSAITLQPVSVEGSIGGGASIGIERFELR
jgi:hypothetical protein